MYPFRNGSCGQDQIPQERKGDRMKKMLTAFLAMAFLVGTIGCGEKKPPKPADTKKPAAGAADATPAPTPKADEKDAKKG